MTITVQSLVQHQYLCAEDNLVYHLCVILFQLATMLPQNGTVDQVLTSMHPSKGTAQTDLVLTTLGPIGRPSPEPRQCTTVRCSASCIAPCPCPLLSQRAPGALICFYVTLPSCGDPAHPPPPQEFHRRNSAAPGEGGASEPSLPEPTVTAQSPLTTIGHLFLLHNHSCCEVAVADHNLNRFLKKVHLG